MDRLHGLWGKSKIFAIGDLAAAELALVLGYGLRHGLESVGRGELFWRMAGLLGLFHLVVAVLGRSYLGIWQRGWFEEWKAVCRHVAMVVFSYLVLVFLLKESDMLSRIAVVMTAIGFAFFSYVFRSLVKKYMRRQKGGARALLLVAEPDRIRETLERMGRYRDKEFFISGVALWGQGSADIGGLELVDAGRIEEWVQTKWVDGIWVDVASPEPDLARRMEEWVGMGVVVHQALMPLVGPVQAGQRIEALAGYAVLSKSIRIVSARQKLVKRAMDLAGGLVGCLLCLVALVLVGPALYAASPGPLIFSQERIGRRGKPFRMYKIRSMVPDAEAQKEDLLRRGEGGDGLLFKMEDDPRIIGGAKGIGAFIRRTSIDELPQFFNVLKGDMSLVGTRPPTRDEWERYEKHHRARLAIKPGITGLWQTSGRSEIKDFEQVVALDLQYIENWNFAMDCRILFKTVQVVLQGRGAM